MGEKTNVVAGSTPSGDINVIFSKEGGVSKTEIRVDQKSIPTTPVGEFSKVATPVFNAVLSTKGPKESDIVLTITSSPEPNHNNIGIHSTSGGQTERIKPEGNFGVDVERIKKLGKALNDSVLTGEERKNALNEMGKAALIAFRAKDSLVNSLFR